MYQNVRRFFRGAINRSIIAVSFFCREIINRCAPDYAVAAANKRCQQAGEVADVL